MPVMDKNWPETARKISQVIAKAWLNDGYRAKLLAATDPKAILAKEGITFTEGVLVRIEEISSWKIGDPSATPTPTFNSDNALITIPMPVRSPDVTDSELNAWINETGPRPTVLPATS
jgi:hypothetical protein